MSKRYGWTLWGILGFVYASVSIIFIPVGLILNAVKPEESGRIFLCTFGGIGIVFLLLGVGFLAIDLRRRHLMRRAYDGGYSVTARIAGIRSVNNVRMNGRHPVVLDCEYQGKIYHSRYLYRDIPETGTPVTVYIDRMDDRIGYVDL